MNQNQRNLVSKVPYIGDISF